MERISDKLKEAEADLELLKSTSSSKEKREWWILGRSVQSLSKSGEPYPEFAHHQHPPAPDFVTFRSNRSTFEQIEIAEVMRPGRKRGDEFKARGASPRFQEVPPPTTDPWESFEYVLIKKTNKNYPRGTWLIVYHNMWMCEFEEWPKWPDHLFERIRTNLESDSPPSYCHGGSFRRILVLSPSGKSLVTIYPELKSVFIAEEPTGT